jgi:hypothetical protein
MMDRSDFRKRMALRLAPFDVLLDEFPKLPEDFHRIVAVAGLRAIGDLPDRILTRVAGGGGLHFVDL